MDSAQTIKTRLRKRAVRLRTLRQNMRKRRTKEAAKKSLEYLSSVEKAQEADLARLTLAEKTPRKKDGVRVKHAGFSFTLPKKVSKSFITWSKHSATKIGIERAIVTSKKFMNWVKQKKPSMAKTAHMSKYIGASLKRLLSASRQSLARSLRSKGSTNTGILKDFAVFSVALIAALLVPGALLAAEHVLKSGSSPAPNHGVAEDAKEVSEKNPRAFETSDAAQKKASEPPEILSPERKPFANFKRKKEAA